MAVKLLSFLGTNKYIPCRYELEGKKSRITHFIQAALVELLLPQFEEEKEVVVFTTEDAKEKNWEKGQGYEGLKDVLAVLSQEIGFTWKNVVIPEGFSSREAVDIFKAVFNTIEEGSKLIFDLTHSFRSLPFLAGLIINYARLLKGVEVAGVYYGAFEKLGRAWEVEEKWPDPAKRVAPVVSLNYFLELSDWLLAANIFLKAGDARPVADLAEKGFKKISDEKKREERKWRDLARELRNFAGEVATCRTLSLSGVSREERAPGHGYLWVHHRGTLERVKEKLAELGGERDPALELFAPVVDKIRGQFEAYGDDDIDNINHLIRWCLEHGLIMQGYTFLRENIITALCVINGFREYDEDDRELQGKIATVFARNLPEERWAPDLKERREEVTRLLTDPEMVAGYKLLNTVGAYRNDLDHAQFTKNSTTAESFKESLKEHLEQFTEFYNKHKPRQRHPYGPPVVVD
ncbi:MAG: hypothetical protein PWQ31_1306 [Eubacteriales bacterium]|nr:hypothetical protein [Eubacteriales bacterium]